MREGRGVSPKERDALIERARRHHNLPSTLKMAGNFAKAIVKHVGDGMKKVDLSTYQRRLDACNECDMRVKTRCTHESCGCFIDKKGWWASEECPLGKWETFGV